MTVKLPKLPDHLRRIDWGPPLLVLAIEPFPKLNGRQYAQRKRWLAWKERVGWLVQAQWRGEPALEPVELHAEFRVVHELRADASNCYDGLLDSLQGILYMNDKQVTRGGFELVTDTGKDEVRVWCWEI